MFAFVRGRVVALVRAATAISLLTGCGTPAALAQSAFWSTSATAGGSWGNPANWQGGTVPAGSGNAAGFVLNFNAGASVTLDGDRTIGTVISASANPWSIDPGSPAGTFTAGTVFVTGTNLNPLTVNAPMAGGNFTKDGSGTLVLTSPGSNYSGVINISAGTLVLTGAGNYSAGGNVVHVASGATLDVSQLTAGPQFGGSADARLNVQSGDTLDGTGTVKGGLKVKSGGTVYPGVNGFGTLSVDGNAEFAGGSNWKVRLSTDQSNMTTSNVLAITRDMTLGDGLASKMNMLIDGTGQTFTIGRTYDYVIATIPADRSLTIAGVDFQPSNIDPALYVSPSAFSLSRSGSTLVLSFTPVPEPAATTLVLAAGVAAAEWRRRRRTQPH